MRKFEAIQLTLEIDVDESSLQSAKKEEECGENENEATFINLRCEKVYAYFTQTYTVSQHPAPWRSNSRKAKINFRLFREKWERSTKNWQKWYDCDGIF